MSLGVGFEVSNVGFEVAVLQCCGRGWGLLYPPALSLSFFLTDTTLILLMLMPWSPMYFREGWNLGLAVWVLQSPGLSALFCVPGQ